MRCLLFKLISRDAPKLRMKMRTQGMKKKTQYPTLAYNPNWRKLKHCLSFIFITWKLSGSSSSCHKKAAVALLFLMNFQPFIGWYLSKFSYYFWLVFATCLKQPSRDNHQKASYPKTQLSDQGVGWAPTMRSVLQQEFIQLTWRSMPFHKENDVIWICMCGQLPNLQVVDLCAK